MQNGIPFESMSQTTQGEAETLSLGMDFARSLRVPSLVVLTGELGAGKTALVRGMCQAWNCEEQVQSPTFTRVNDYQGSCRVIHADLYRLRSIDEALMMGFDELLDSEAIVIVEWAEKALALLPLPRWEVSCAHGSSSEQRVFEFRLCRDPRQTLLPSTEAVA